MSATPVGNPAGSWYGLPRPIHLLDLLELCLYIVILVGAGRFSKYFARQDEMHKIMNLIAKKPKWTPERKKIRRNFQLLYLCQAPSIWLLMLDDNITYLSTPVLLFIAQFVLYLLWPIIYFQFRQVGLAAIDAIALWFTIDATIYYFWKANVLASLFLYPHLAWITTTTTLSIYLWKLNRDNPYLLNPNVELPLKPIKSVTVDIPDILPEHKPQKDSDSSEDTQLNKGKDTNV